MRPPVEHEFKIRCGNCKRAAWPCGQGKPGQNPQRFAGFCYRYGMIHADVWPDAWGCPDWKLRQKGQHVDRMGVKRETTPCTKS
jgi:hypothetical protein